MKKKSIHSTNSDSRRNFIKNAAAAAAFMIVPRHVIGGKGFLAPSDKLLIAGIGVGVKGNQISPIFMKVEKQKLLFYAM